MSDQSTPALEALRARLTAAVIVTDAAACYRASFDNLRLSRLPAAVLRPEDEEQVAVILEVANRFGQAVTTRGAGTATTGATSPVVGGWVLDLSGWTECHIDPATQMAYVQPGLTVAALDTAARRHGLMYAPDPSSRQYATIGGTIATNAGGLRGAKYGVTRDYVLALEGFLPTGEFVRWGGDVRKYVSGYNMRDLWIGSEGMLGVITGAVLKLVPAPGARRTCLAAFADEAAALDGVQALLASGLVPAILEFLDSPSVSCTVRLWQRKGILTTVGLPPSFVDLLAADPAPAVLLIEYDGDQSAVDAGCAAAAAAVGHRAAAFCVAADEAEAEGLWRLRRSCSQAMFEWGDGKLNEDVVVPLRAQHALLAYTRQLSHDIGLAMPTFGHAADGNFHVHIMYRRDDPDQCARARRGIDALMRQVIELEGVITGEHGIGLAKSPFFGWQHSEAEIKAMRAIKQALDPNNILNPDLMWQPFEVWDYPREDVHLPWDH
jgi:glycolate oxidase